MLGLSGDAEGQRVDAVVSVTSLAFQQISSLHTLDVEYAGGALHLEWTTTISPGSGGAKATGTFVVPAGALTGAAFCSANVLLGEESVCSPSGGTCYEFSMGGFSTGPACPGSSRSGFVNGCVVE